MSKQPFIPALDLKGTISNGDKGLRPLVTGAWKMERDTEGFALFMDIHRRSGMNLNDILKVVKGIWQEDNEAVSFLKKKGRIIKFKLNPKKKEEEEVAKKKDSRVKIIKKGKQAEQVKKPVGKQVKKQAKQPVGKKVKISKNGSNPWTPPFGAWAVMEELRIGGTMDDLLKRVKARFKKDKISSDPVGRLGRVIYVIDNEYEPKVKPFKITRTGKGKNQVLKAVKK